LIHFFKRHNSSIEFLKRMVIQNATNLIFNSEDGINDKTSFFHLVCGIFVLLYQFGLQLQEAGSVHRKNTSSVFMRGLSCLSISFIASWLLGFAFAFSPGNSFIGYETNWFASLLLDNLDYSRGFVYAAVASFPSSIMSSAMSERSHITGHLVLSLFVSILVFPLPAHWVWNKQGWLNINGCKDIGGAIVLHMLGGVGALVGSLIVGRRIETKDDIDSNSHFTGHSLPLIAIGGMFSVIGLIACVIGLSGEFEAAGILGMNSLIGGSSAAIVTMILYRTTDRVDRKRILTSNNQNRRFKSREVHTRRWSFKATLGGFLTGIICVSGAGHNLPTWGACIAGLVGGITYYLLTLLLKIVKVDDPSNNVVVHCGGGIVGAIAAGLVNLVETRSGTALAWQLVGLISVAVWVIVCLLLVMLPLLLCGKLRIKETQEVSGIDLVKMLEQAYNDENGENRTSRISTLEEVPTEKEKIAFAYVMPYSREKVLDPCQSKDVPGHKLQSIDHNNLTTSSSKQIISPLQETSMVHSQTQDTSSTGIDRISSAKKDLKIQRATIKEQKDKLRPVSSSHSLAENLREIGIDSDAKEDLNNSQDSVLSDISVKSDVILQASKAASNNHNFNYLGGKSSVKSNSPVSSNAEDSKDSGVLTVDESAHVSNMSHDHNTKELAEKVEENSDDAFNSKPLSSVQIEENLVKNSFTENLDIMTTKFRGLSTIDITAQDEYFSIVDIEDGLGQMSNINVTASENYSEPVSKQDSDYSVKSENAVSDHSPVNSHKMEEEQSQIISS